MEQELPFPIARKLEQVFDGPARFRGAHGGRGSTKSWGFARRSIQRMVEAMLAGYWGFGSDPLAVVRCWIKGKRLFIDYEAGGKGIEIKDTAGEFEKVPGSRKHMMRADNARPELINHMQTEEGFRIIGADKWPGSRSSPRASRPPT